MTKIDIVKYNTKRRKLAPVIDLSGFFLLFGVSGIDSGREKRMNRRLELEIYANVVTLTLNKKLENGIYIFEGLPERVNRRGWKATGNTATSDLSDDGLEELQEWLAQGIRQVEALLDTRKGG